MILISRMVVLTLHYSPFGGGGGVLEGLTYR